ncbi:MAG: GNAT family N-acetyltransferase [Neptuniibacter sp.]
MEITYQSDRSITAQEFIDLLKSTSLGERRPLNDESCIEAMLKEANLLITAWNGDQLIGVARSLTDFHYCCYLSDLAVAETFQNQGVGQALILETEQFLEPGCRLILLAAPQAESYYPKLGFNQHHSAWTRQVS